MSLPVLAMLIFVSHFDTCQALGQINNSQAERLSQTSQSFINSHVCHHGDGDISPRNLQGYPCWQSTRGTMGVCLQQHQMLTTDSWHVIPLYTTFNLGTSILNRTAITIRCAAGVFLHQTKISNKHRWTLDAREEMTAWWINLSLGVNIDS